MVCDIWLSVDYLASDASELNLVVISFDRYFSVTTKTDYDQIERRCIGGQVIHGKPNVAHHSTQSTFLKNKITHI